MNSQLELDLAPPRRDPRAVAREALRRSPRLLGGLAGLAVAWAPVWLPALVCVQITLLGLLPALNESHRLDRVGAQVAEREARLGDAAAELEQERRKLGDEIYRERLRKGRRHGGEPPRTP